MEWIIFLGIAVVALVWAVQHQGTKRAAEQEAAARAAKYERLSSKYAGDPFLKDILAGSIRQGMTREQVTDAWGPPAAAEERVLKTKVVHTLKYGQTGSRSFNQQVKIENGYVVGWSQR